MDFKDSIKQIADRVNKLKGSLPTEEATKNALVLPFLSALGYDVFNPLEVLPEMTCDIGTKKGEKIDYAILHEGNPVILIECKQIDQDLNLHDNQLLRYFNVSTAKFGVLTNGVVYRFYTDLKEPNKMDDKPFLEVNLLDLKDAQIEDLKKFHKSYFDINSIMSSASELKYMGELKGIISQEFSSPSPDFVKYLGRQVYDGQFTVKILDQFTPLVKRAIGSYINDIISDRLKAAIKQDGDEAPTTVQADTPSLEPSDDKEDEIVTTEEEIEAFYIVKSILRNTRPAERVTMRDAKRYCAVFADDNNRKTICRFYFNSETTKKLTFLDDDRKEIHYKLDSLDDIYNYSDKLIEIASKYL